PSWSLAREIPPRELRWREVERHAEAQTVVDLVPVPPVDGFRIRDIDLGRARQEIAQASAEVDLRGVADDVVIREKLRRQVERRVEGEPAVGVEASPQHARPQLRQEEIADLESEIAAVVVNPDDFLDEGVGVARLDVAAGDQPVEVGAHAEPELELMEVL